VRADGGSDLCDLVLCKDGNVRFGMRSAMQRRLR
jgi:hypothetical protein